MRDDGLCYHDQTLQHSPILLPSSLGQNIAPQCEHGPLRKRPKEHAVASFVSQSTTCGMTQRMRGGGAETEMGQALRGNHGKGGVLTERQEPLRMT